MTLALESAVSDLTLETTDLLATVAQAINDSGIAGVGVSTILRTTGDGSAGTIDVYTITLTDATTTTFNVYNGSNGADGAGIGDMVKATFDTNDSGIVDDSELVNGLSVETAVPANALFSDTVFNDTAISAAVALNTTARHDHANKSTLDNFGEDGGGLPTYNGVTVDTTIAQRDVYDGFDSLDNTISLSANRGKLLRDVQDTQQTAINLNTAKVGITDEVNSNITGVTGADVITNMISLTQSEYDAIVTPHASTFYVIVG